MRKGKLKKLYKEVRKANESYYQELYDVRRANDQLSNQLSTNQAKLDEAYRSIKILMNEKVTLEKQVEADGKLATLGLIPKYQVKHADGTDCDPRARYFVLRYDRFAELRHREASRAALETYQRTIEPYFPELAKDLRAEVSWLWTLEENIDKKDFPVRMESTEQLNDNHDFSYPIEKGKDGL